MWEAARRLRRRAFGREVTVSPNVFLAVSTACVNRCAYCGFRARPPEPPALLAPREADVLLARAAGAGCTEALLTLGERADAEPSVRDRLAEWGFADMVDYLAHLAERALDRGLLPHSNAGVLSREELGRLARANASMGLMLESASPRLGSPGGPHDGCPGKEPSRRLEHMASAGRLAIPFTTGIIVGVGETREERARALRAIAAVHASHGHVQEVIVQPFSPARGSPMEGAPPPSGGEVLDALALARLILPPKVSVQVPPNLLRADLLAQALEVADDLGGVSPLTPDLISPDRPWPSLGSLGELCAGSGFVLRRRLPVRERFVSPRHLAPRVLALAREALARG